MKSHPAIGDESVVKKLMVAATTGLITLGAALSPVALGPTAYAEPANDSVASLNELSEQAKQLTETMRTAQQDFDRKMQLLAVADKKYADDLAALRTTEARLADYQRTVDRFAAAVYMGGRTDGLNAALTATSPTALIDKMAMQQMVATEVSQNMSSFRRLHQEAQAVQVASAESAANAKAAVDDAVAARDALKAKQTELRTQIALVSARYSVTPQPAVMAALGITAPIPTVGMSGLVPNAWMLAAYIMATYPNVKAIGGVRSDPLPDHPSGRAIDIMIGGDMALGDAINADVQSQAARFGVQYTMWRVAAHFDHVHITVS